MGADPVDPPPPAGYTVVDPEPPPGYKVVDSASAAPMQPPGIRPATAMESSLVDNPALSFIPGASWLPSAMKLMDMAPSGTGAETTAQKLRELTPFGVTESAPGITGGAAGALATVWNPLTAPLAPLAAAYGAMPGVAIKRAGQVLAGVPIQPGPPPPPPDPFRIPKIAGGMMLGGLPGALSQLSPDTLGRMFFPKGIPSSATGDVQELAGAGIMQAGMQYAGDLMGKLLRVGAAPNAIVAHAEELGLPTPSQGTAETLARKTFVGREVVRSARLKGEANALEEATQHGATLGQAPPLPEDSALKYIDTVRRGVASDLKAAGEQAVADGYTQAEGEVNHLISRIAPEATPLIQVGTQAQKAAKTGIQLAKADASRLYDVADALNQSATVDISQHVAALKQMSEEAALSPTQDPAALILYTKKLAENVPQLQAALAKAQLGAGNFDTSALTRAIDEAFGNTAGTTSIPYTQARELQKWLAQRMTDKTSGNIAQGRLKNAWGSLSDAISHSIDGTEGGVAFKEATSAYREFSDVAKRGAVPKLLQGLRSNPEDVLALIDRGPSRVMQLRKAIIGYAEQHGSLAEQAAANQAWDDLGRAYAEQNLMAGGVKKFPAQLARAGDETLDALYGREQANNMRTIASSISALKSSSRPSGPPNMADFMDPAKLSALQRLEDLDQALRMSDKATQRSGYWDPSGMASKIVGVSATLPFQVAGGLISWAATNRIRTRTLMNVLATGVEVGSQSYLRLVNSYLDYQRDMSLVNAKRGQPAPPPTPPPPAPPPAPAGKGIFGFGFLGG